MFIGFDYAFLTGLLLFVIVPFVVCVMSPGPDFALVARNSLMYSRRTGVFTALGTSVSLAIHATYTLVGIAVLIRETTWGFTIIQVLGAAYLFYIGWQSFRSSTSSVDAKEISRAKQELSPFVAFRQGFLTDLLNPMAMVFFLSIFSMVITEETTVAMKVVYGVVIFVVGLSWFSMIAMGFSHAKVQGFFDRMGHWVGKITGGVMVALGIKLALVLVP